MMLRSLLSAMHASGGGGSDPYWSSVKLLVANDNMADASTSFDDQSGANHTVTAVGQAQYDSATAPTGMTTSMILDGTDRLTVPDSADWSFGTGDFTIEGMVYYNGSSHYGTLAGQYATVTSDASWWVVLPSDDSDNNLYFEWTTNGSTNNFEGFPWNPTLYTWYHVAITREGSNLRAFVGGTQVGTTKTNSANFYDSTTTVGIGGAANANTYDHTGSLACVRITKGVARYTTTFTPPTLPLPTS